MKSMKYLVVMAVISSSGLATAGNGQVGSGDDNELKLKCSAAVIHQDRGNEVENYDSQVKAVEIYAGAGIQPKQKITFVVNTPDGILTVQGVGSAMVAPAQQTQMSVQVGTSFQLYAKDKQGKVLLNSNRKPEVGETITVAPDYKTSYLDANNHLLTTQATQSVGVGKIEITNPKGEKIERNQRLYTATCKLMY